MTSQLKVLVYGATGSQAGPVVHHLLANGHEAYALTRNPNTDKAKALQDAGATLVSGNLGDYASLVQASQGMDGVSFMIPAFLENPMNYLTFAEKWD